MRALDPDPRKWSDDDRLLAEMRPERFAAELAILASDDCGVPNEPQNPSTPAAELADAAISGLADEAQGGVTISLPGSDETVDYHAISLADLKKLVASRGIVVPDGTDGRAKQPWVDLLNDHDDYLRRQAEADADDDYVDLPDSHGDR